MAKRRSGTANVSYRRYPVRMVPQFRPIVRRLPSVSFRRAVVRAIEDRRFWTPARRLAPPRAMPRAAARLVPSRRRLSSWLHFAIPDRVAICVRRKIRREVLFANKLTRRGAGGSKRRNEWSAISCK